MSLTLLTILFVGSFVVRLYRFDNPIADWHSWRQADTSAVSRNFVLHGFDILHPRFDDLSNVASGLDNPQGYRFVEFPIYNVLQAGGYMVVGRLTLEEWGRLVTIFASLFSLVIIFLLAKKYIGNVGALAAAFVFGFLPYNIYYSRVILPDPSMVAATLGAIYFFDKTASTNKLFFRLLLFGLAIIFAVAALLLKPYAIFFFLPIIVISWNKWGIKTVISPFFWVFFIISCIPLVWWRWWMTFYPEGIPVSNWLFNGGNIRFTGAYFYWLLAERLSRLILGYFGLPLILVGFLSRRKSPLFVFSFVLSSILYMIIIARGNVQHDYYQILIIPSLALLFGLGVDFLFHLPTSVTSKLNTLGIVSICILCMMAFGWYVVRDYFNINNPSIVIAGEAVDRLTPKNAKIIAPYDGDTSFLYQTRRKGWASFEKDLPEMVKMGADYLVLVNPTPNDFNGLGKQFSVIASSQQYLLLDLHKEK
jgi:hypothetical protein